MIDLTLEAIYSHAASVAPMEACGVIVRQCGCEFYIPVPNIAEERSHFVMDPGVLAYAEDFGDVTAYVHTHVHESANPSEADLAGCEKSGLPWVIVGWPSKVLVQITPSGWRAPLIGRTFSFGVHDCYALARDYYRERHGIYLPDYPRHDSQFWKFSTPFVDNFRAAGFCEVSDELRESDAILMQLGGSKVPNHCAVYLGDSRILHHLEDRLSGKTIYGGYWRDHTTHHLRHRDLC